MLFRKDKNKNKKTDPQAITAQDKIFIFIYKGIGKDVIETDTIVAKYEYEAVEQFTQKHPNNEQFAYKYDFVDPDTGKTYTFRQNWGYVEYLKRIEELKIKRSAQLILDKKHNQESDSESNLQPLYYRRNGAYYESGVYVDPSKLKQTDLLSDD